MTFVGRDTLATGVMPAEGFELKSDAMPERVA
jgi:hypothetical protein